MRRYIYPLIAIVFLLCGTILAQRADETFFKANKFYEDGDYNKAISFYTELLDNGFVTGNIYYNIGNSYYRLGERGKALLYYKKASSYIIQDEALFANTAFVKSLLGITEIDEDYLWYEKIFIGIRDAFSTHLWFYLSWCLFLMMLIMAIVGILRLTQRNMCIVISWSIGAMFLITIFFFINSYKTYYKAERALVIVPKAEVRYSPSYAGVIGFEINEGMEIEILSREAEWSQIRFGRNKNGWVETEVIEKI